jgi:hypothetical protein
MSDPPGADPERATVFCGLCRRPHVFEVRAGLQFRECPCGGIVSLLARPRPAQSRWRLLEID